jgi:hypothetical protein
VVERIVSGRKPQRLEALYAELVARSGETRDTPLVRE